MDTEILTYSRAKGAFAGPRVEGASIREDDDSRNAVYGPKVTTRALLLGQVPAPTVTQPFLAAVRGAKAQAVAAGKAEVKAEATHCATSRFGQCLNCEQEIHAKRLEPIPWVRYCITCQELIDGTK